MFDIDRFIEANNLVGKRVEIAPHLDRWMQGDRFATVVMADGDSGVALLYRLRFDRSGDTRTFADTNFRVL